MIPYGKQSIDEDDIRAVVEVLRSDWITTGPKVPEFEGALCSYIGCRHAVAVNSGTSALDIAVQALELPPGSEAITTPITFVATSNALVYNGVRPVFADIEEGTRNIDPDSIRSRITDRTRAIVFVDFAGQPCAIREIREIADEHDLFLIEDACHALGAEYRGTKVGTLADMTVFSFHPVKHITTGEGGAVTTEDPELNRKLLLNRSHGIDRDALSRYGPDASWAYDMKTLGRNYRLTDIQATLGTSQLRKLDMFIGKRAALAARYDEYFRNHALITPPVSLPGIRHAWHIYTVLLDPSLQRDAFFRYLREHGIGVNVHYIPVYKHTYYQEQMGFKNFSLPVTEEVFSRIITLPLYPDMSFADQDRVFEVIENYLSTRQT
jgi:UDP-4-amino-4,6-dideoxy-N-acetyl-beta-L-altrosamine transaminase